MIELLPCQLVVACSYKTTTFDFERQRQPEQYRMIVERQGAIPPDVSADASYTDT